MKIAVISDLHCRDRNENARTTHLYSDLYKTPINSHPVEALKSRIKDDEIIWEYLFCLGDVTDKINKQCLISCYNHILEIAESLGVEKQKIIILPGNHDVDSRNKHDDPCFNYIVKTFDNKIPVDDGNCCTNFWDNSYFIKEFDDLIVLGYNSVYNHTDEAKAKLTDINDVALDRIVSHLNTLSDNTKPRIAISHHHPTKYSNFEIRYRDGDSIEKGELFLDLLARNNFSLYMHGHKHIPRLEYKNELPIFCSGSFSSLENIQELSKRNTFHIVDILVEISNNQPNTMGKIRTYEFVVGKGWNKSLDQAGGFPAFTGFGFNGNIVDLGNAIIDWYFKNGGNAQQFDDLVATFDCIYLLTPTQQDQLVNHLDKIGDLKIIPSIKADPQLITKKYKR